MKILLVNIWLLACINFNGFAQYLGYNENCIQIQRDTLKKILKSNIGDKKYNSFLINGKLDIYIEIDSTGIVKYLKIIKFKFLNKNDIEHIKDQLLMKSKFCICHDTYEARNISKKELFAEPKNGLIFYRINIP